MALKPFTLKSIDILNHLMQITGVISPAMSLNKLFQYKENLL